jgi:hypothetical protein
MTISNRLVPSFVMMSSSVYLILEKIQRSANDSHVDSQLKPSLAKSQQIGHLLDPHHDGC